MHSVRVAGNGPRASWTPVRPRSVLPPPPPPNARALCPVEWSSLDSGEHHLWLNRHPTAGLAPRGPPLGTAGPPMSSLRGPELVFQTPRFSRPRSRAHAAASEGVPLRLAWSRGRDSWGGRWGPPDLSPSVPRALRGPGHVPHPSAGGVSVGQRRAWACCCHREVTGHRRRSRVAGPLGAPKRASRPHLSAAAPDSARPQPGETPPYLS